ncbi:S-layer homology domain-containing protein [Bacillus sp. 1P06AnD]|uniref:S-layer homology domain-containing protein n=1 Tax=Bacillus sp. 1P06AnD TaxID=3132208 RepID=UPI0039A2B1F8
MSMQKKSHRTFIATASATAVVASAVTPIAAAASFNDVTPTYKDAIDFVASKGVQGLNANQFGIEKDIKRADAAVMLAKVLGLDTKSAPASGFTDVPKRAITYVNAIKHAGITNGKSKTSFGSEDMITRGELAVWIQKGFSLKGEGKISFSDVKKDYVEAVKALVSNKITNGVSKTSFGTTQKAKRGDFALFLYRAGAAKAVTPEQNETKRCFINLLAG